MASSSSGVPIHSLLIQSGEYSDIEADSSEADEEYGISASTDWHQKSSSKRKQKQRQSDIKKSRTDSDGSNTVKDVVTEVSHVVYLRGKTTKLTSNNPLTVCQNIRNTFGPVQKVERRGTSLKLTCTSGKQRDAILACSQLGDTNVLPSLPYGETRKLQNAVREKTQRVVISGVPVDVENDSIIETTGATEVRRILKRGHSPNEKIPTTTVVLCYSCSMEDVPSRVQIGYLSFKTRIYIPQVTRCYKCQKFGHIAAHCRKEIDTCPVCAGPHKYTDCTDKDNKKCANCGNHTAPATENVQNFWLVKL